MSTEHLKSNIQSSIQAFAEGNLSQNCLNLFSTIEYNTERRAPLSKPTFDELKKTYIFDQKFNENKALVNEWLYVDVLFQLSREELTKQTSAFDTKQVDQTIIETYLFFAIELTGTHYTRTELAGITREVNRLFPMPAMILFKYDRKLTLSVINRRLHKRDENKDVLEKVTLIKDISIDRPLRAHIEILFDLSMSELLRVHKFTNFVQLHQAWQKTLDIKELNKRFYSELFNWYLWAVRSVKFPNNINDEKDNTVYNSESIIRLITRLIFVWFIKEKNLVPDHLFHKKTLEKILKNFNPDSETTSVYYRAILQNLFFATLNTPMDKDITDENKDEKRQFINVLPKTGNDHYLDQTKYRYKEYFADPDKALELFSNIPFLNGGLFECLDFKEGTKEIRYDGFSSTAGKQAFVPDMLFFANEQPIDLNSEYGSKGKKYKVEGLLNILNSYKFTITENTPIEEEIALDPELLGKVFENLLASYNPETQTTARKQTGSFYTPREIVNYMVDESLIAHLNQTLGNNEDSENRLRKLFTNNEFGDLFSAEETDLLIKTISEIKILDPACGSGAFPMGVLHRLVDLLNKLDPDNKKWNERQKQRAIEETTEVFNSGDKEEREIRLHEINKAFDLSMNHPDYARKLFLIENCIYGVDIQQIAIQISKLRFFIALMVDQKVDNSKPNRNILSMPNLETKFVAANSLIGLEKPKQLTMLDSEVEKLENDLASIRHKIFYTRKYAEKKALKKKEKEKREALKAALINSSFSKDTAAQISEWNPFDPMHSATFFDHVTMFNVKDGFDVVIGNPPYVDSETMTREYPKFREYLKSKFLSAEGNWDLFVVFTEMGLTLCKSYGKLAFIIPNKLISAKYTYSLRGLICKLSPREIIDYSGVDVFKEADVYPVVIFISNQKTHNYNVTTKVMQSLEKVTTLNLVEANQFISDIFWDKYFFSPEILKLIIKITNNYKLKSIFPNIIGAATVNEAYQIKEILRELGHEKKYFKFINTGTVDPYRALWGIKQTQYIKGNYQRPVLTKNDLDKINPTRTKQSSSSKIIISGMSLRIEAFFDEIGNYCAGKSTTIITGEAKYLKTLAGVLNSKLVSYWFSKYFNSLSMAGGYFNIGSNEIGLIPIPKMTFPNDIINKLVDEILNSNENGSETDTAKIENQIDELVFKLYDLTYEEVKIIAPDFWLSEEEYDKIKL